MKMEKTKIRLLLCLFLFFAGMGNLVKAQQLQIEELSVAYTPPTSWLDPTVAAQTTVVANVTGIYKMSDLADENSPTPYSGRIEIGANLALTQPGGYGVSSGSTLLGSVQTATLTYLGGVLTEINGIPCSPNTPATFQVNVTVESFGKVKPGTWDAEIVFITGQPDNTNSAVAIVGGNSVTMPALVVGFAPMDFEIFGEPSGPLCSPGELRTEYCTFTHSNSWAQTIGCLLPQNRKTTGLSVILKGQPFPDGGEAGVYYTWIVEDEHKVLQGSKDKDATDWTFSGPDFPVQQPVKHSGLSNDPEEVTIILSAKRTPDGTDSLHKTVTITVNPEPTITNKTDLLGSISVDATMDFVEDVLGRLENFTVADIVYELVNGFPFTRSIIAAMEGGLMEGTLGCAGSPLNIHILTQNADEVRIYTSSSASGAYTTYIPNAAGVVKLQIPDSQMTPGNKEVYFAVPYHDGCAGPGSVIPFGTAEVGTPAYGAVTLGASTTYTREIQNGDELVYCPLTLVGLSFNRLDVAGIIGDAGSAAGAVIKDTESLVDAAKLIWANREMIEKAIRDGEFELSTSNVWSIISQIATLDAAYPNLNDLLFKSDFISDIILLVKKVTNKVDRIKVEVKSDITGLATKDYDFTGMVEFIDLAAVVNLTSMPQTAEITATPYRNVKNNTTGEEYECEGTPFRYTILVPPTPVATHKFDLSNIIICPSDNESTITEDRYEVQFKTSGADVLTIAAEVGFGPGNNLSLTLPVDIPLIVGEDQPVVGGNGATATIVEDVPGQFTVTLNVPGENLEPASLSAYLIKASNQWSSDCVINIPTAIVVAVRKPIDVPKFDIAGQTLKYYNGDMVTDIFLTPFREGPDSTWQVTWERIPESDVISGPTSIADTGITYIPRFWAVNNTNEVLIARYKYKIEDTRTGCTYYSKDIDQLTIEVWPKSIDNPDLFMNEIADITVCGGKELESDIVFEAKYGFETLKDNFMADFPFEQITFNWVLEEGVDVLGKGAQGKKISDVGKDTVIFALSTDTLKTVGTGRYRVTPRLGNSNGRSVVFNVTTSTVDTIAYLRTQRASNTFNVGDLIDITVEGADFYKWEFDGTDIGGTDGAGQSIALFEATKVGTTTIKVTPVSAAGCEGAAKTLEITVNAAPGFGDFVIPDVTYCSGSDIEIVLDNTAAGSIRYDLSYVSGTNFDLELKKAGNKFNDPTEYAWRIKGKYENKSKTPASGAYELVIIDDATGMKSDVMTFVIMIDPTASISPINNIVASNGTIVPEFTFTGNAATGSYSWELKSGSDSIANLSTKGEGPRFPQFTAVNLGTELLVAKYEVTARSGECAVATQSFEITVYPSAGIPIVLPDIHVSACDFIGTSSYRYGYPDISSLMRPVFTAPKHYDYELVLVAGTDVGLSALKGSTLPGDELREWLIQGEISSDIDVSAPIYGTYRLTAINTITKVRGATEEITVTILPDATINEIDDITVINGTNVPAFTFTGGVNGSTFSWELKANEVGFTNEKLPNLATRGEGPVFPAFIAENFGDEPVTAIYVVTAHSGTCATTEEFAITVYPAPSIEGIENWSGCKLADLGLTFEKGANTKYNLEFVSGTKFAALALDTTTTTAKITGVTATNFKNDSIIHSAVYKVTPSNATTGATGVPSHFVITLYPALKVAAPASLEVVNGTSVPAFTFTGSNEGTQYKWELKEGSDTIPNLALAGRGDFFPAFVAENFRKEAIVATYVVTPFNMYCEGDTVEFSITVHSTPQIQPIYDVTLCNETPYEIVLDPIDNVKYELSHVAGDSLGLVQFKDDGLTISIAGLKNEKKSPVSATYAVTAVNTETGAPGDVKQFTITVLPNLVATDIVISNMEYYNGQQVARVDFASLLGGGTGVHYKWNLKKTTPEQTSVGTAGSGLDFIPAFRAINTTNAAIEAIYQVVMVFDGCESDTAEFKIKVYPTNLNLDNDLTVTPVFNQTVCAGVDFTSIDLIANHAFMTEAAFAGEKVTFRWTMKSGTANIANLGTVGHNSSTPDSNAYTLLTTSTDKPVGTATYEIVALWKNNISKPIEVVLTRNAAPVVAPMTNVVLCNNSPLNVRFNSVGTVAPSHYEWSVVGTPTLGLVGGVASSDGINIAKLVNTTNDTITATISVVPANGACKGEAKTFKVTVLPTATVNKPANLFVEKGKDVPETVFTTSGVASKYKWTSSNADIYDNPLAPLAGVGNIPKFKAQNRVDAPITSIITVTPVFEVAIGGITYSCDGEPVTFTITVASKPAIDDIASARAWEGCSFAPVVPTGLPTGDNYYITWTGGESIGLVDNAVGAKTIPAFTAEMPASSNGNDPAVVEVTVTSWIKGNGIADYEGNTVKFTYTVYPTAKITGNGSDQPTAYTVACEGELYTIDMEVTATGHGLSYQWYKNHTPIAGATSRTYSVVEAKANASGIYYAEVKNSNIEGVTKCMGEVILQSKIYDVLITTDVISQRGNDILVLDADPATNGGYEFTDIQWYEGNAAVGSNLTYFHKSGGLDVSKEYYFTAKTKAGTFQSCTFTPTRIDAVSMSVAPNPVEAGQAVTIKGISGARAIQLVNSNGAVIGNITPNGTEMAITMPNTSGIYIIRVVMTAGNVNSFSIIVK